MPEDRPLRKIMELFAAEMESTFGVQARWVTVEFRGSKRSITLRVPDVSREPKAGRLDAIPLIESVKPRDPPEETLSADETADAAEFEPTDFQLMIFHALEGKAFHGESLAAAVGCNPRSLYKKNGLKELVGAGWVSRDGSYQDLGYYRPDAPPKELRKKTGKRENNSDHSS